MARSKAVPSVTDSTFGIRVPSFIVLNGRVLHRKGAGTASGERIMGVGDFAYYRKHGRFQICCIHDGHAVINHWARSDKLLELLVPKGKWLHVSNGSYKVSVPNFQSYLEAYSHLETKPNADCDESLRQQYLLLADAREKYEEGNGTYPRNDKEEDAMLLLKYRIDYGWVCASNGQPIPEDCKLKHLKKCFSEIAVGL